MEEKLEIKKNKEVEDVVQTQAPQLSEENVPIVSEKILSSIKYNAEESERIFQIISEILTRRRIFHDEKDESSNPSYTNFRVPYHMTCRLRYSHKREQYERQFQRELSEMLNHQPTAYDAARFNRHLCITTLWPPLHNRREIEYFQNNFFKLNRRQKKRLEFLMNTNII